MKNHIKYDVEMILYPILLKKYYSLFPKDTWKLHIFINVEREPWLS